MSKDTSGRPGIGPGLRRLIFGVIAFILFVTEVMIGMFATGWVRNSLGDILVVILIWSLIRTIYPYDMRMGWILPAAVLIFAFTVEFLQYLGICDIVGIENRLLRTVIGTGFAAEDLLCYTVGIIPCLVTEILLLRGHKNT